MSGPDLSGYSDQQLQAMLAAQQSKPAPAASQMPDLSAFSDEQLQAMLDARKAQQNGLAAPAGDNWWYKDAPVVPAQQPAQANPYAGVGTPVQVAPPTSSVLPGGTDPWAAFPPVQGASNLSPSGGHWWADAPVAVPASGASKDPYASFTPVPDAKPLTVRPGAPDPKDGGDVAAAVGGGVISGVPVVGPYLQAGVERGIVAPLRMLSHGESYDDALKAAQDFDQATEKNHPVATGAGQMAGAALAMAPVAAAAPALMGGGTAPLLARIATGGVVNAGLGGADAAVRSGGDLVSTGLGTALGGAAGALGPAAASGLGAGYRRLMSSAVAEAPDVPAAARQYLVDRIRADDPAAVLANMRGLGEQGMLADAGPGPRGIAQGLATKPGPGQQAVMAPLTIRNAGTNARLDAAVNGALGPDQSPLAYQRAIGDAIGPHAQAQQAALAQAGPLDVTQAFTRINNALQHAAPGTPEYAALHEARASLAGPGGLTQDARQVYSARQGMDDRIDYTPGGPAPSSAVRSAQGAYRQARSDLNDALRSQVSGYSDATDAIRGLSQRRDAVDQGMASLNMRPDDLAAQFAALTPEQQRDFAVGQRALIAKAFGTKENDLQALRGFMQGDQGWNLQNTATIHGQGAADTLTDAARQNLAFRDTYNKVTQNSETARNTAAAKGLADAEVKPLQIGSTRDLTTAGALASVAKQPVNALLRAFTRPVDNTARDLGLARVITAQGDDRNRLLAQVLRAQNTAEANAQLGTGIAGAAPSVTAITPSMLAAALRTSRQPAQKGR